MSEIKTLYNQREKITLVYKLLNKSIATYDIQQT